MGGYRIELKPQPDTSRTHTIHTQYAHNTHTICTQSCTHIHTQYTDTRYTHTQNTEHRYNNHAAHTEQNITPVQQRTTQPQRIYTTQSCTHSFDFYHLHIYIKKLYNIAIYEFYTFCSPYL